MTASIAHHHPDPRAQRARGFTLVELLVVLIVVATIAAFVTTSVGRVADDARADTTRVSLSTVRDAIVATYRQDLGVLPAKVADLLRKPELAEVFDPRTRNGWRGPYLRPSGARYVVGPSGVPGTEAFADATFSTAYGLDGDPAVNDGYGRPIVLQVPDLDGNGAASAEEARHARLLSAGSDRAIDTPANQLFPTRTACDDDLVLYLEAADLRAP